MASLESTLRQRDPSFMMPILLVAVEPNRGLFVVTQTAPALWIARDGSALRIDAGENFGGDQRNLKIGPIPLGYKKRNRRK